MLLVSHDVFSLVGASHAAINDWICAWQGLSARLIHAKVETPFYLLQLLAPLTSSMRISKVAVVLLQLQYLNGSFFQMLMEHSLSGK